LKFDLVWTVGMSAAAWPLVACGTVGADARPNWQERAPEMITTSERDGSMWIDVIGVAVAFIALAALGVVLMSGER
jgi:hypothetical protein